MGQSEIITDLRDRMALMDDDHLRELLHIVDRKFPEATKKPTKPQRKIGALKGMLVYMADDFDEPLDCFSTLW